MIHSFLLIGQSNAAGRGFLQEASPLDTCGGRLKMLRNGRWQGMFRPVNPDRSFSGSCFAESFSKAYAEVNPDVEVGIIPCADGGTALSQWMPGELLFDNAVNCARLAMRTSVLMGVLWHQGEGDCVYERYSTYTQRFVQMAEALRKALSLPSLPILVGGLGDFLANRVQSEALKNYPHVNSALLAATEALENTAFVSAEGLGANPDNLHFNAAALEEFGIRYFDAFRAMNVTRTDLNAITCDDSLRSEMEKL